MNTDIVRGLVAGECLHPANLDFRIHALPPKRFARMEVLHAFDREHDQTTPTRPYAHSSPPQLLQGAGENAEWFAFSAGLIASGDAAVVTDGWIALAGGPQGRRRPGTAIALDNMRRGLRPPQSGHDNPHYFDDLAMVRALAAAVLHEDEQIARALAVADAHATHDLDGVWAADATVVLFRALMAGASGGDAARAAAAALPSGSWSRRLTGTALQTAEEHGDPFGLAVALGREVCDWIYSYPVAAPETLAVLLAHVSVADSAEALLAGTAGTGRNGTTLAALAGAAAAALFGGGWIPAEITLDARLAGIGVPALAGSSIAEAIEREPH